MSATVEGTRVEELLRVIVAAANCDHDVRVPLEERDDLMARVSREGDLFRVFETEADAPAWLTNCEV